MRTRLLLLALAVAACAKDSAGPTPPPPPPPPPPQKMLGPANGSWSANGPDFVMTLALAESVLVTTRVGPIAGIGAVTGPNITGGTIPFTATGTDSAGSVGLTLSASALASPQFAGQMLSDTAIQGYLDGSGFTHVPLRFTHHPVIDSLTIAPSNDSLLSGRTRQFTVKAFDLLGRQLTGQTVSWSTSDTTLATISPTGLLTARASGIVTVRAQYDTVVAQASLKLLRRVATALVNPIAFVLPSTLPLSATLLDSSGVAISGRRITWTSLNTAVARITPFDSVQAVALGSADIRATVVFDGTSFVSRVTVRTTQLTALAAGEGHTCGIDRDSTAVCWGDGFVGQLGAGVRMMVTAPIFVVGGRHFRQLAAGRIHTCGLTADSTAYCWGGNGAGQLGHGDLSADTVPLPVTGGLHFASITAESDHTCGIASGGAAYCWGTNFYGELGAGSGSPGSSATPLPVVGGLSFSMLSAGSYHTCGIASDSTAYCWGYNQSGSLGDSTTTDRNAPVRVAGGLKFVTMASGNLHTCAITAIGNAYCWGAAGAGQLGDNSSALQQNAPDSVHAGGVTFSEIAAGYNHTCARATSGDIYCWGDNAYGQRGPNGGAIVVPVGLSGTAVVTGGWHSCAVTAAGAYCWGFNDSGQLGSGGYSGTAVPVKVLGQP